MLGVGFGVGDGDSLMHFGREAHKRWQDGQAFRIHLATLKLGAVGIGGIGKRFNIADVGGRLDVALLLELGPVRIGGRVTGG